MLDTMTVGRGWALRQKLPGGRRFDFCGVTVRTGECGTVLRSAEASLPKLLFGHNGRVIETQEQIDDGLNKFAQLLSREVLVPDLSEWKPWRLDLCWNFNCSAKPLILAHAPLRVFGIRRGAAMFDGGQGVSWFGAKSRFIVRLYNKSRKMRVPGSVLRAEISLSGDQLVRRLGPGTWHRFDTLYQAYRRIMATIPPILKPPQARNWQEAVAAEPLEIRQRILARLAHKPTRTFYRWQRRIEAAAAQQPDEFSWANVLPANSPPQAVSVEPTAISKNVGLSRGPVRAFNPFVGHLEASKKDAQW